MMRITGAHREDDLDDGSSIITFFHPATGRAGSELAPRTVFRTSSIISFTIGKVVDHAEQRYQELTVQLIDGPRYPFNVVVSHDNGRTYDIGLIALVADLLTAAMR